MKGAEAIVKLGKLIGKKVVIKDRIPKKYRIEEIDQRLRKERTKKEARLLHKAKLSGVRCPTVLEVEEFRLVLELLPGKRKMNKDIAYKAGEILAKLHDAGIIHGDFTVANLLYDRKILSVIDFGLGFFSTEIEHKAIDVFTMINSTPYQKSFLDGYKKHNDYKKVLDRMEIIKKRTRYS